MKQLIIFYLSFFAFTHLFAQVNVNTRDAQNDFFESYDGLLLAQFPVFSNLFETGSFSTHGDNLGLNYGFRYMIQLGYLF
jgi:hypothetical protein